MRVFFISYICKKDEIMTNKEKYSLLTVEDLKKIDDVIYTVSGGSVWAKMNSQFWRDALKKLQETND